MAQSFSIKKYLSKISAHQLIEKIATKHGVQLMFEINDQTPRKLAVSLMEDSIKALDPEVRLEIIKEFSYISSITSSHTASLGKKLYKEQTGASFEPEIKCNSDSDTVLYLYLQHKDIGDKIAFLYPFYSSKSYLSYEANISVPPKSQTDAELTQTDAEKIQTNTKNSNNSELKMLIESKLTGLSREFTRLANKEDNATEQEMEYLFLDDILYLESKFQGSYDVQSKIDNETGEINNKHVVRKIESVRIAYIPNEEVMLIAGNVSKQQKLIFMDTFLRVVCDGGYEEKIESYDLTLFKKLTFDFGQYNKEKMFIKAVVKSITLSYAEGKKKLRLTLPGTNEHMNLSALKETLDDLNLIDLYSTFEIVNIGIGFIFHNKEKEDRSVNINCSLSSGRASLCPLFEYERYAKSILKNAGVYEGWKVAKEK
ncbi:MAG: hypothetical protein WCK60_00920 [Candidatus Nomurabacteria bacterium]